MRLHMHGAPTSFFAATEARAARFPTVPPPPRFGVFRAFLRMHRPLTSMFRSATCRLWGQFVGTICGDLLTVCVCKEAARQGTAVATRWTFVPRCQQDAALHTHCTVQRHAPALINDANARQPSGVPMRMAESS